MKIKRVFFAFLLFILLQLEATAAVWENKADWSPEWEKKYNEWVFQNWKKNIFQEPNKFYSNLAVDCADAVYSMRLIFAAENNLPFAMRDPSSNKNFISNAMTRWDSLPEEERKREFLVFIFNVASTESLPNDTYPIAISRDAIVPGTLLRTDQTKHHSWTIREILDSGIPFLIFSSRPAKTQLLERQDIPSMPFLFPKGLRPETNAGFRAFRNPKDVNKPVWEIEGYSLEQYQHPIQSWRRIVQEKLALRTESPAQRTSRLLDEACKGAIERVEVIQSGLKALTKIGPRCMNATEYDDHSTPNRDQRMHDTFVDLDESIQALGDSVKENPDLWEKVKSISNQEAEAGREDAFCLVNIAPNLKLSLAQIRYRSLQNLLSNNPHDSLEYRWGYKKGKSARAQNCPEY